MTPKKLGNQKTMKLTKSNENIIFAIIIAIVVILGCRKCGFIRFIYSPLLVFRNCPSQFPPTTKLVGMVKKQTRKQ